ncbi:uncharacterized protein LOC110722506 [Chenopodium quinoa]|uniref:uncharacterized protein LOC110722506 n=1 Tax=Chenopodium quinoa TaxID=63459 RepID=UPI000B775AF3|nr:uncharacterized protein LOC110722506 [Chenopodium quinoa]
MSCVVHTATDLLEQEETRAKRKNTKADKFISAREYYAYRLQIRPNNMLLRAGRCFQQYIVDIRVPEKRVATCSILIILKPAYKLKCPSDYDRFVCAEIPAHTDGILRRIVLAHMMHGPCGMLNPECPCMKKTGVKRSCKNKYPKQFCNETTNNKDGYPIYRRRDTGEQVTIRNAQLDNQWVIPYDPYPSMLFDCHLNVEVCSTIKAVKYLYKYVYKGHNKISYNVVASDGETVDEIHRYQLGRWVSPCEAAWRIFSFDLFKVHPSVLPLQVHLPYTQTVHVHPHERLLSVVSDAKRSRTQLTEFFAMNAADERGLGYLYGEFCEHYTWHQGDKKWKRRVQNRISVGRLAFVFPAEGERFFLRLLLLNVRSPKSFEDLRTVDSCLYSTFQEDALKRGLIEDDDAANSTMAEACETHMPAALRRLFATVLMFCQPRDPAALWNTYYPFLAEDYSHRFPNQLVRIQQLTVRAVEQHLEAMGKSLAFFGLEELVSQVSDEFICTKDIIDALDAPIPQECLSCRSKLNSAQNAAFECIMEHVVQQKAGAFFIDGPGGTGKTFLYNALYAEIRQLNKIVLPTATSGIAAANIPSGRTAHSRFKIPIDDEGSLACDVPKQGSLAALLKETALIIWDEASMAKKQNVESLDLLLQDICGNKVVFGGKVVVLGGDFRQVLPVVPRKTMNEAVEASIVTSYLWPRFVKFRLTENIRAREDPGYASFLLGLGNGELQQTENAFVELLEHIVQCTDDFTDLVAAVTETTFPEIGRGCSDSEVFTKRAILTPMNDDVDAINTFMIEKFPGCAVTYKSFDAVINDTCSIYPTEFINKLCPGGMSPHELVLKENFPVILLRNLLPSSGLCNGTRYLEMPLMDDNNGCYAGTLLGDLNENSNIYKHYAQLCEIMNTPPKMKLEPVYLDELTAQSKDYKVKVTVAEKGRAQPSPKKPGVVFQTIILEDEKCWKLLVAKTVSSA